MNSNVGTSQATQRPIDPVPAGDELPMLIWFLSTTFWALFALAQFIAGLVFRLAMSVLWLFWPLVVMGLLIATAQPCEAGWISWLWGSDTRHLERSLDVAKEAARVANEASQAQAQQAVAQAEQNARLAETLGQLSSERSNLADHLRALTELGLKDSQWAAAVSASGPVLVCITVLLVAGLALWLANRAGDGEQAGLSETVDLLVEEIATYTQQNEHGMYGPSRLAGRSAGKTPQSLARLPMLTGYTAGYGDKAGAGAGAGNETAEEAGPEEDPREDGEPEENPGPIPF
jgi:hypothetical protein